VTGLGFGDEPVPPIEIDVNPFCRQQFATPHTGQQCQPNGFLDERIATPASLLDEPDLFGPAQSGRRRRGWAGWLRGIPLSIGLPLSAWRNG
jgi:hypothetical protein